MDSSLPSLYGPNHGNPYYEAIHMEWYDLWHERNGLPLWCLLFTNKFERMAERMRELSDTMYFLDMNPWIIEYA